MLPLRAPFFRFFKSLFQVSFIWIDGNSHREFRAPDAMFSRQNEASENPDFARSTSSNHSNPQNCGILRRRGRSNQILHKIWHLWAPELRWRGFTQINGGLLNFPEVPKICRSGSLDDQKTIIQSNYNNKADEFKQNRLRYSHVIWM